MSGAAFSHYVKSEPDAPGQPIRRSKRLHPEIATNADASDEVSDYAKSLCTGMCPRCFKVINKHSVINSHTVLIVCMCSAACGTPCWQCSIARVVQSEHVAAAIDLHQLSCVLESANTNVADLVSQGSCEQHAHAYRSASIACSPCSIWAVISGLPPLTEAPFMTINRIDFSFLAIQYLAGRHNKRHLDNCDGRRRSKAQRREPLPFGKSPKPWTNCLWYRAPPEKVAEKLEKLKFKGLARLTEDFARSDCLQSVTLLLCCCCVKLLPKCPWCWFSRWAPIYAICTASGFIAVVTEQAMGKQVLMNINYMPACTPYMHSVLQTFACTMLEQVVLL